jgi:hypothetical protein
VSASPTSPGPGRDRERRIGRRAFLERSFKLAAGAAGATSALAVTACGETASPAARRLQSAGGGSVRAGVQTFRTRTDLQPPQVLVRRRARQPGNAFVLTDAHGGPGQQGPMMIDRTGRLVWFKTLSADATPALRAFNVRVQTYRGEPVLTWFEGAVVSGHGQGQYVLYDDTYRQIATVQAGNGYLGDLHEFVLTEQGTALFTCYGQAASDLPLPNGAAGAQPGAYFYGVVQEVDVATGEVLFQWRSDDHVDFADSYREPPQDPSVPWDYFHVNSIAVDPVDGQLWISGRNTWACYKVDRRSGAVIWTLGGKRSDYPVPARARFAFQHHVIPHPGGLVTIFDNESGPPNVARQSRGLMLHIDATTHTTAFVREYHHTPPVLSGALGSVQPLSQGRMFVGWGDSSYFTEYDALGRAVVDARLASPTLSYRAFQQPWVGRPSTQPAVVVSRSGETAHLDVSWNGATEHRAWRVLGGKGPNRLAPIGTAAVAGFETRIVVPQAPPWLAVEGLDARGRALRRSAPRRV